ncbi:hypothetical protein [Afifella sp. IM 167]|uniref:hypothetical protein n=1 Tax=Afifella sp. IM 167 TaxID=2033586 RepID=UPI001CCFE227|nr:hypothetical protein [Afifella sp. IM 167]MBZ8133205.1 hypothetical protein [Afifella sp. IM 167]
MIEIGYVELMVFLLAIIGAVGGFYKWLTSRFRETERELRAETAACHTRISALKDLLDMDKEKLADLRLYMAEKYVSKDGFAVHSSQVMDALGHLGQKIDDGLKALHVRVDRVVEGRVGQRDGGQQ